MIDTDNINPTIDRAMTKARKKRNLAMIAEVVAPRIVALRDEEKRFTFSEIAWFSKINRARVSELVNHRRLSEKVLVGLVTGGFLTTKWMADKLRGKIDDGQLEYVRAFSIYEMSGLRRMVNFLVENGENPEAMLADVIKEKYGEGKLYELLPNLRRKKSK